MLFIIYVTVFIVIERYREIVKSMCEREMVESGEKKPIRIYRQINPLPHRSSCSEIRRHLYNS